MALAGPSLLKQISVMVLLASFVLLWCAMRYVSVYVCAWIRIDAGELW